MDGKQVDSEQWLVGEPEDQPEPKKVASALLLRNVGFKPWQWKERY